MSPSICPTCGAVVPPNSRACPACGADEETGWSEQAYAADPDLPDEDFDYDNFVKREFGPEPVKTPGIRWLWWGIAILLVVAFLAGYVF